MTSPNQTRLLNVFSSNVDQSQRSLAEWVDDELLAWSQTTAGIFSAMGFGAAGDGVTDDKAAINATLVAVRDQGGGTVRLSPGRTYKITGPLIVHSRTVLDARGATIVLAPGSNSNMVQSQATYGTGRDRDITIIGGLWDRGGNAAATPNAAHFIIMRKVDNLVMRDLAFVATAAKFCILIQGCTQFVVEGIDCRNVPSDGVHVMGPARDGIIRDIGGTCGDDMVAVVPVDYTPYLWGDEGDVTDILIEDIHPLNTVKRAVAVVGGVTGGALGSGGVSVVTDRITIRGVSGTGIYYGIWIGGDASNPGTDGGSLDNIVVEDVSFRTTLVNGAAIYVNGKDVRRLRIDGLHVNTGAVSGQVGLLIDAVAVVKSLIVRGLTVADSGTSGIILPLGIVNDFVIAGVSGAMSATAAFLRCSDNTATSRIDRLVMSDIGLTWATVSGTLIRAIFAGTTLPLIELNNIALGGGPSWIADLNTVSQIMLANVASGGGPFSVRAAGALTIRAGAMNLTGGASSIAAGGTLSSKMFGFRCDVSTLTKVAGDMAHNTNAALACGIGPVVSDGALWKGLYSGATA